MDDDPGGLAVRDERDLSTGELAAQRTEVEIRNKFDCSGTVWATHRRSDGKSVCHNMPWHAAPDVLSCGVRIEHFSAPGVPEIVPPGDKYAPDEVNEQFLLALGGGRRYRLSLRKAGNTIPHSYLTFDLTGVADPIPFPHERSKAPEKPPEKPPAAPLTDTGASAVLRMGADPVAALIGSAIADIQDSGTKLAFALALDRGVRAESLRQEQMQRDERLFQFMGGLISTAARGNTSGGGDALALLREQNADLRRRQEDADRRAADEAKRARELELAAARGSAPASSAPNPFVMAAAQGFANGLPGVMQKAVEMAGPDAARAVVSAGAQMAGAVAG